MPRIIIWQIAAWVPPFGNLHQVYERACLFAFLLLPSGKMLINDSSGCLIIWKRFQSLQKQNTKRKKIKAKIIIIIKIRNNKQKENYINFLHPPGAILLVIFPQKKVKKKFRISFHNSLPLDCCCCGSCW